MRHIPMAYKWRKTSPLNSITMDQKSLKDIARSVKESRVQQKYTQQDLADKTGISLRSIQRIENAEVLPRQYTLNVLAQHLNIIIDKQIENFEPGKKGLNINQKIILTIGVAIFLFLLATAYVLQSATFPESSFELFLYIAAFVGMYTLALLAIWK